MRMRKKKNLIPRMDACAALWIQDPAAWKGRWREHMPNAARLRLELGCGKGRFTAETAAAHPEDLYVAVERVPDAMVIAMERCRAMGLTNVLFIDGDAAVLEEYFAPGEVDLIYINFCDPWPSVKHSRRRLTHEGFLRGYRRVLREGGQLHFKTDNHDLFEWSLFQFPKAGFALSEITRNLHGQGVQGIMTDYEEKFHALGIPINRCVGTMLGAAVTAQHPEGLPDDTIKIQCTGSGGQSFGAFLPAGVSLTITGDANDYFGKGLSGGILAVHPSSKATYKFNENLSIGNVAFYGATAGKGFINGLAGQRFGVRNSGATLVCEGVGNHGCEYMTGGVALILGEVGVNFAAGMSGGVAYVWDPRRELYLRVNKELVSIEPVESRHDIEELRSLIAQHVEATSSQKGKAILADFEHAFASFKKILPRDYDRILRAIAQCEERGVGHDEAEMEAFCAVTGGAG